MHRPATVTRRQFATSGLAATVLGATWANGRIASGAPNDAGDAIVAIEYRGVLIGECTLPGETRADGVVPRHANGLQLSRDRWLVIYSTHGYRGVDDERSIIYQVRADAPDGRVIKEGFLAKAVTDWRPPGIDLSSLAANQVLFKQHGHMVAFGVPAGAIIGGKSPPHAGLFVAKWRALGRVLDTARDYLLHSTNPTGPGRATQVVEWIQFRLARDGNDIEIVQPVRSLRQTGYETSPRFCSADVAWMNQSFTPAIPFNAARTEWADCNHFDLGRIAPLKYRFNPEHGLYEWVETGPLLGGGPTELMEASLVRQQDHWFIVARQRNKSGAAWSQSREPFASWSPLVFPSEPSCNSPLTAFNCSDGVLRIFTGDAKVSPHRNGRDPLYCWNVDAEYDFAGTNRRVLFDSVKAGLPIRPQVAPKIDFCELFPAQGRSQLIVHGVSTRGYNFTYENRPDIPPINEAEKQAAGIYYARITYRSDVAPAWQF